MKATYPYHNTSCPNYTSLTQRHSWTNNRRPSNPDILLNYYRLAHLRSVKPIPDPGVYGMCCSIELDSWSNKYSGADGNLTSVKETAIVVNEASWRDSEIYTNIDENWRKKVGVFGELWVHGVFWWWGKVEDSARVNKRLARPR